MATATETTGYVPRMKTRYEQELRPGDKLPAERNLAEMMQVSRPVVREALRALALMRVVDIRQGDGTYVRATRP